MTRNERIWKHVREIEAGRARIAREAQRDADPIAHDNWLRQHEAFFSEPIRRPPVSKNDEPDIVYRARGDFALQTAPAGTLDTFEAEPEFTEVQQVALAVALNGLRAELLQEVEKVVAERDTKIARLQGTVDALLGLVGKSMGLSITPPDDGDLPNWRRHDA